MVLVQLEQVPAFLGGVNPTPWPYGRAGPSRISIVGNGGSGSGISGNVRLIKRRPSLIYH